MSAKLIDGRAIAADLRDQVAGHVRRLGSDHGVTPGLAVILVGDDPASDVYVRAKGRQAAEVGIASFEHRLPDSTSQETLARLIADLNADPAVHGILVQLPLPRHIDAGAVIGMIDPAKDVDGFHVTNVGLLGAGGAAMVPCTPLGCLKMIRAELGDLKGKTAVVVGRSNIVGRPMAQLLLRADCTVIVAHRHSTNTAALCRMADILVVAVGQPQMVPADWIKPGAIVLDVGINRLPASPDGEKGRLVGDVDFDAAAGVAGAITPVPGGVGPMTIACLLLNTLTACCRAVGAPEPAQTAI